MRSNHLEDMYEQLFDKNQDNLHRNLITLNLFQHKLPRRSLELLETRLQLQLTTKLWSPQASPVSAGQMALYIQGLKASCVDPFNFYGLDLVQKMSKGKSVSRFDEWLIQFTLCLMSSNKTQFESLMGSSRLQSLLEVDHQDIIRFNSISDETVRKRDSNVTDEKLKAIVKNNTDTMAMKALTLCCYSKFAPDNNTIKHDLNDELAKILWTQEADGSFNGNLITTALALQAFIESGLDKLSFLWNRKAAVEYINNNLDKLEAIDAYHVVPAFHETWLQIGCKKSRWTAREKEAEQRSLFANVYRWFSRGPAPVKLTLSRWVNIQGNGTNVSVSVPGGSDLMKALKHAAKNQTVFNYDGTQTSSGFYVRSVGDIVEDGDSSWTIHHVKDNGTTMLTRQSK